jgi:hypothetical protein
MNYADTINTYNGFTVGDFMKTFSILTIFLLSQNCFAQGSSNFSNFGKLIDQTYSNGGAITFGGPDGVLPAPGGSWKKSEPVIKNRERKETFTAGTAGNTNAIQVVKTDNKNLQLLSVAQLVRENTKSKYFFHALMDTNVPQNVRNMKTVTVCRDGSEVCMTTNITVCEKLLENAKKDASANGTKAPRNLNDLADGLVSCGSVPYLRDSYSTTQNVKTELQFGQELALKKYEEMAGMNPDNRFKGLFSDLGRWFKRTFTSNQNKSLAGDSEDDILAGKRLALLGKACLAFAPTEPAYENKVGSNKGTDTPETTSSATPATEGEATGGENGDGNTPQPLPSEETSPEPSDGKPEVNSVKTPPPFGPPTSPPN